MYWLFLIPFMAMAQNPEQGNQQYAVFENAVLTPQPDKVQQFEEGIAAHNKKFHASDPYGARVYYISNGPNVASSWPLQSLSLSKDRRQKHTLSGLFRYNTYTAGCIGGFSADFPRAMVPFIKGS